MNLQVAHMGSQVVLYETPKVRYKCLSDPYEPSNGSCEAPSGPYDPPNDLWESPKGQYEPSNCTYKLLNAGV